MLHWLKHHDVSLISAHASFLYTHGNRSPWTWTPEAPVDGDVPVQQDVRQASLGTVVRDDADVGHLDRASDELGQIWVVQFPGVQHIQLKG